MLYVLAYPEGREALVRFPYEIGIVVPMAYPSLLKTDENASEYIYQIASDPFFDILEVGVIGDGEWSRVEERLKVLPRRPSFILALQAEILLRGANPSSTSEDERRRAEELFVREAERACNRGFRAVALCTGPNVPESERRRALEAFAKTLGAVAEAAGKCGMQVYVETFDTDVDKKRLLGRIEDAARLVEEVRGSHPNVSILWDLSHAPLLGETPEDLKPYSSLIGHVHIGAAKRVEGRLYDWHPGFYRPGSVNDERDVARLLAVLEEMGYRGAISFEVKPEEGQDVREVLGASKEALVRAYRLHVEGGLGR